MARDSDTTSLVRADQRAAREPQLPMLRFGLRQFFWGLTAVCVVVAGVVLAPQPGIAPLVVLVAALAVTLHVVGTSIGTRLRAHADERIAWQAVHGDMAERHKAPIPNTVRSSWHERGLTTRWRWWLVASGAVGGGLAGGLVFAFAERLSHTPIEIAFGAFSMAVVGGWLTLLGHGFYVSLLRGWREAVGEQRNDRSGVSRRP